MPVEKNPRSLTSSKLMMAPQKPIQRRITLLTMINLKIAQKKN